ncbi:hypothetical protein BYT27DRAFT_7259066 [Phlegmacium glaucopus]|nr:hypothetical protein BYT27DRAFT_7259066 [Phlegmacium glaucopus]
MPVGNDITSRIVWNKLKSMYSHVNVHAQFDLHGRLTDNTLQNASDYIHFLGEFNTCHSHLATMDAPLTKSISHFVQTWSEIEATCDYPSPPNTLYTKVITHLKQECLMLQAHAKPGPGTEYANLATIKKTSCNPLGVKKGGGAAGQWPGGQNDPNVEIWMSGLKYTQSQQSYNPVA